MRAVAPRLVARPRGTVYLLSGLRELHTNPCGGDVQLGSDVEGSETGRECRPVRLVSHRKPIGVTWYNSTLHIIVFALKGRRCDTLYAGVVYRRNAHYRDKFGKLE